MSFFRILIGLPLAAAITLGLFAAMSSLIAQDPRIDDARAPIDLSDIFRQIAESKPESTVKPRPLPADPPPPPDTDTWDKPGPVDTVPTDPLPGGDFGPVDPVLQNARPNIKVAPAYPQACASRGAEGVVIVQYDITDRGEVTNVRIISSDHRCFDRTVIKTVLKWKYPPQARRGVTERFVFTLTE